MKFYGYDGELWNEVPGDYVYRVIDPTSKNAILNDLDRLYTTALGKSLIEQALNADSLRFVGLSDFNADPITNIKASPAYALTATVGPPHSVESVQINYTKTANDLYWFNAKGTLINADPALTIIHELAHVIYETPDPTGTDAAMNAAGFDFEGPQVRAQNVIARQLGTPDQVRVSYTGAVYGAIDLAKFTLGVSYTDGATVDVVRRGNDESNDIDHSARTTKLRDLIFGLNGIDQINGGGGNDWLYGGDGNDTIRGGSGYDVIYGDDRFDFTQIGDDRLYGDAGNDRIYGGKGTDHLYGGIGVDILVGGAGADFIYGEGGNDTIYGDFGVDDAKTVEVGVSYDDIIDGGANNDTIYGGIGNDSLNGGTGLDILWGDEGHDVLGGGDGDDILYAGPGTVSLVGGKGNDIIDLSQGAEDATILYIKSDGLDTVRGPTGSNITLSFIDLAANQLNFEFRYTSVLYTLDSGETSTGEPAPRYYDFATYQGDLHITSKLSAAAGLILEGASVAYKQYPYYQEYLHPGLQKITFAAAPTIVTASGAIIFGLGVGNPDIDISFVEVVTLPDPAGAPTVFAPSAMLQGWLETADTDSWTTDMRDDGFVSGRFASDVLLANLTDYAFA